MKFAYSIEFTNDLKEAFPDETELLKNVEDGDTLKVDWFLRKVRPDLFRRSREEWAARPKENRATQQMVNS